MMASPAMLLLRSQLLSACPPPTPSAWLLSAVSSPRVRSTSPVAAVNGHLYYSSTAVLDKVLLLVIFFYLAVLGEGRDTLIHYTPVQQYRTQQSRGNTENVPAPVKYLKRPCLRTFAAAVAVSSQKRSVKLKELSPFS